MRPLVGMNTPSLVAPTRPTREFLNDQNSRYKQGDHCIQIGTCLQSFPSPMESLPETTHLGAMAAWRTRGKNCASELNYCEGLYTEVSSHFSLITSMTGVHLFLMYSVYIRALVIFFISKTAWPHFVCRASRPLAPVQDSEDDNMPF